MEPNSGLDPKQESVQLPEEYAFSERRACALMLLAVGTYRYVSRRSDEPPRTRLVDLAREKPRFGYRRLQVTRMNRTPTLYDPLNQRFSSLPLATILHIVRRFSARVSAVFSLVIPQ